jgi:hypothetical protein
LVVILIPGYFYSQLSQKETDVGGVTTDNRAVFMELIDGDMLGKKVLGILSQGLELHNIKVKSKQELQTLMQLKSRPEIKEALPSVSTVKFLDQEKQIQVKPLCILMAHMLDIIDDHFDPNDPEFQKELETILRVVPSYLDIMIMIVIFLSQQFKMGKSKKQLTARNILACIQFSQNLMQKGWIYKDPFMQLPYFQEKECNQIK